MTTLTLTEKAVSSAIGPCELWDTRLPKFGLRVREPSKAFPKGKKSWQVMTYDPRTQKRQRIKVGDYPLMSMTEAREKATTLIAAAQAGEIADRKLTVSALFASYLDGHCTRDNRSKTLRDKRSHFRNHIEPRIGDLPLKDVRPADIAMVLAHTEKSGSSISRNVYATLSHAFGYAVDRQYIRESPVTMRSPKNARARDRVLSTDEVARIWAAADGIGYPFGDIVKLLFLTGQRRENVGAMEWAELEDNVWVIPAAKFKADREQRVPLSVQALHLIERLPSFAGARYVFYGKGEGQRPFSGWSKAKERLDVLCGVRDWRLHDIRRTVASEMQALGVVPFIIEVVEGRISGTFGGVTGVYQRFAYEQEKREALTIWANHLSAIVAGR